MSRHQGRLLLCSAAAVALIVGATLVVDWFLIDFTGTRMTIGMRSGTVCVADGTCTTVGLSGMGAYRVLAEGAFWNALLLALLVLGQCGMSLFTGAASATASRIGYVIGSITLLCAFAAGFLFAPDPPADLRVMGLVVARTFAPVMLVAGSLLGILALHYAQLDQISDEGEYKPVIVRKDPDSVRLPVTPLSGVNRLPHPGDAAGRERLTGERARSPSQAGERVRPPTDPGIRTRTPSQQVERIPLPGHRTKSSSQPGESARPPTDPGTRPQSQEVERIALPGDRTRSPSQPGEGARPPTDPGIRTRTPSQQVERIALPGDRTKSPSQPGERARPPTDPGIGTRTPSQPIERIAVPGDRTKSPSQPGDIGTGERSRSPSQQPLVARTMSPSQPSVARTTSPSLPVGSGTSLSQPAVARTVSPAQPVSSGSRLSQPAIARTTSASQPGGSGTSLSQPLVARTSSSQPLVARTPSPAHGVPTRAHPGSEPPDDPGVDIPSRARTSSSGPIDLAARLSGAPIAVSIKPPLPEPVPVPADQIPVAPESGLVIRKRTPSAGPISGHQLPPSGAQPTPAASASAAVPIPAAKEIPVSPESGLVIRTKPPVPEPSAPARAFGSTESPRGASGITPPGAMPSIALRSIDPDIDNPLAPPAQSQLPAKHEDVLAQLPPKHDDAPAGLALGRTPTPGEPAISRVFTPPDKPAALRGKLKYAVNMATLTSMGITAQREDGTTKHVGWDDIIGIIARRLPAETPYEGATFADLVSTSGSTLRILPWTRLDGAPVRGDGEQRVRGVVQLIAARCLEAKLDSWTKVFADGAGHAAQLPSTNTLAAHDDKLA